MAFDVGAVSEPLDERTAGDLVVEFIAALQAARADWVARNGSPEVIYGEALSYVAAEIVNSGNDVIAAVVESVLENLYLVPRGVGVQALGELTLTFDSAVSTTIATGTRFSLPEYGVELLSTVEVTVTTTNTAVIQVVTSEATSAVNGVGATAAVDILDAIPNALSIVVSDPMSGGADVEDDTAYIARARNRLARVTNSLVVPDHFSAYCLESGLCSNATTIGAWDGADIGTAAGDGGYVTSVVYGLGGLVSSDNMALLAAEMQEITADGITVGVIKANQVGIAVTAAIKALPGTVASTVKADVEAALDAYLDPETWEFGETVRVTSLTAICAGVTGVDYVDSLTILYGAPDVTLTADTLAAAMPHTITVT